VRPKGSRAPWRGARNRRAKWVRQRRNGAVVGDDYRGAKCALSATTKAASCSRVSSETSGRSCFGYWVGTSATAGPRPPERLRCPPNPWSAQFLLATVAARRALLRSNMTEERMIEALYLGDGPLQDGPSGSERSGCTITSIRQYRPERQFKPEYTPSIESRPAITGYGRSVAKPVNIFESGAILIYLADRRKALVARPERGSRRSNGDVSDGWGRRCSAGASFLRPR